jgi:hypothetical protein
MTFSGGRTLKIYELNPRFIMGVGAGELFASGEPEDVVVLGVKRLLKRIGHRWRW